MITTQDPAEVVREREREGRRKEEENTQQNEETIYRECFERCF